MLVRPIQLVHAIHGDLAETSRPYGFKTSKILIGLFQLFFFCYSCVYLYIVFFITIQCYGAQESDVESGWWCAVVRRAGISLICELEPLEKMMLSPDASLLDGTGKVLKVKIIFIVYLIYFSHLKQMRFYRASDVIIPKSKILF